MRIVADANVLIRILVDDEAEQAQLARRLMEISEVVVIPTLVMCEVAWVLRRSYRFTSMEVHGALSALVRAKGVQADRHVLQAGLDHLSEGGGFADGCILEMARSAGCPLATFDEKLIQLAKGRAMHVGQLTETT